MKTLIRQAILVPNSVHLSNYQPIMPTYQGQIDEEQMSQLIGLRKVARLGRKDECQMSTAMQKSTKTPSRIQRELS